MAWVSSLLVVYLQRALSRQRRRAPLSSNVQSDPAFLDLAAHEIPNDSRVHESLGDLAPFVERLALSAGVDKCHEPNLVLDFSIDLQWTERVRLSEVTRPLALAIAIITILIALAAALVSVNRGSIH